MEPWRVLANDIASWILIHPIVSIAILIMVLMKACD